MNEEDFDGHRIIVLSAMFGLLFLLPALLRVGLSLAAQPSATTQSNAFPAALALLVWTLAGLMRVASQLH